MKTNYSTRYAASPQDVKNYDTSRIREEFLIDNLMEKDVVNLVYTHYDRFIAGSAVPTKSTLLIFSLPTNGEKFLQPLAANASSKEAKLSSTKPLLVTLMFPTLY